MIDDDKKKNPSDQNENSGSKGGESTAEMDHDVTMEDTGVEEETEETE